LLNHLVCVNLHLIYEYISFRLMWKEVIRPYYISKEKEKVKTYFSFFVNLGNCETARYD
jgi:hypothetical protein